MSPFPLECLQHKYESIEDVEAKHTYVDDGRVPHVPFGFINKQWEELKAQMQNSDELWSYSVTYGFLAASSGVALVRKTPKRAPGIEIVVYLQHWVS